MTEVQGTRGIVLHWARKANYSKKAKREKGDYMQTPVTILPEKKGERHKRAKLPKGNVRAPARTQ